MDRTEVIRKRYNRVSNVYNLMERGMETGRFNEWRQRMMSGVRGPRLLEIGVGTGANLGYYPKGMHVTAIDFSQGMLRKAREKAKRLNVDVDLRLMDVQNLEFADNTFDTAITSCVFCSVPDPSRGLSEIRRVLKPDGQLLMIEHVLSCQPIVRQVMHLANPLSVGVVGANINRETGKALAEAGFSVEEENLLYDVVKFFRARPNK